MFDQAYKNLTSILIRDFLHFFTHNEWFTTICYIVLGMLVFHWFSRVIYRFLVLKFDTDKHVWMVSLIKSVHAPWLTFFWIMAISFIIPIIMLRFHIDVRRLPVVNTVRSFFFIISLYWTLLNLITNMEQKIAPRWRRGDQTTVRAVAQLSRVTLTVLFILSILPLLGFQTSSLLAFGGFGALGVTYAAKDTLANFLGGMMIFLDRPFSVGDWIRSPDRNIEGYVEHIGWRLTRIRTLDKCPLYVPNGIFSMISIENPSRMSHRHINTMVGVRYDDANVIAPIAKDIDSMLRQHPGVDQTQSVLVHLMEFAASSLNINVYVYTKATDSAKFRPVQQDIFLKIIAIVAAHGAECAFPTTTVLLPTHDNNNPL